jgi:hypothetical protein
MSALVRVPNAEQARAIALVRAGYNLLLDSVPGSGKTTCVSQLASALRDTGCYFVLITFNRALAEETRERISALGLTNISAHTFHAFVGACLQCNVHDDETLEIALNAAAQHRDVDALMSVALAHCTDLVIDEAQDVKPLLFRAWSMIVAHLKRGARTHIFGDRRQGVYASMSADARFLTHADALLGRRVARVEFRESHRLTIPMARFVNDVLLQQHDAINTSKPGPEVKLWRVNNAASDTEPIVRALISCIQTGSVAPGNVFVLFPTVRRGLSGKTAAYVSRKLRMAGIPVYASHESDSGDVSALAALDKVVLTTHHQSKGRERALTVAFGFDDAFARMKATFATAAIAASVSTMTDDDDEDEDEEPENDRDKDKDCCIPDQLFVAATRGFHELWLVQMGDPLPAIRHAETSGVLRSLSEAGHLVMCPPVFTPMPKRDRKEKEKGPSTEDMGSHTSHTTRRSVQELATFFSPSAHARLNALASVVMECVQPASRPATAPCEVPSIVLGGTEIVSDINGIAVVADYETRIRGGACTIWEQMRKVKAVVVSAQPHVCQKRFAEACSTAPTTTAEFLRLAAACCAVHSGHWHKQQQLKTFEWSNNRALWWDPAITEIDTFVRLHGVPTHFQHEVNAIVAPPTQSRLDTPLNMYGHVNAASTSRGKIVAYNFKSTAALTLEHKVETMLFAHIIRQAARDKGRDVDLTMLLLNVLTGEAWRVKQGTAEGAALADVCNEAVRNAFRIETHVEDDVFVALHSHIHRQEEARAAESTKS